MKHSILILALVILITPACKKHKKDETKPDSTTERQRLLMNRNWKIYKIISEGEDITGMIPGCAMDNVIFHFTDVKTGYADEGPEKCDANDPQLVNFYWSLTANETRLVVDDHTSKDTLDIIQVSNTEMKLGTEGDTMTLRY